MLGKAAVVTEPPINHMAELWKLNAEGWKQIYLSQRRLALYAAIPGLICGIGVFTSTDAQWWLNAVAGATIATSLAVLSGAAALWWNDRKYEDRKLDQALAERFWHEHEGGPDDQGRT